MIRLHVKTADEAHSVVRLFLMKSNELYRGLTSISAHLFSLDDDKTKTTPILLSHLPQNTSA